jgi:hypothetical protein
MSTSGNEGDAGEKEIPTMEALREQVSNEVGRAIENSMPTFVDNIQSTILDIMNEKFEELKESLLQEKGKAQERSRVHMTNSWLANLPCLTVKWTPLSVNGGSRIWRGSSIGAIVIPPIGWHMLRGNSGV